MNRRIDAHFGRTQLGQIIDLASENNDCFMVDPRREPTIVIIGVQDSSPPPHRRFSPGLAALLSAPRCYLGTGVAKGNFLNRGRWSGSDAAECFF
jgi:hypothetical protein